MNDPNDLQVTLRSAEEDHVVAVRKATERRQNLFACFANVRILGEELELLARPLHPATCRRRFVGGDVIVDLADIPLRKSRDS